MIRAILFDMDGVLVDSIKAWFTTFNMVLKKFEGKEITLKEFESDVWAQDFNITRTKYFSADKSLVDSYFYSLQPKLLDMMERDEKVCSALKLLKEKYVLAVVTNTQTSLAEKVLSKLEIIGFFSKVIGIGKDMKGKPEPDIVLLALEKLGLKSNEAVFVGDTIWDRMAAGKAKVKFIGYRIKGDERIGSLEELNSLL